ncbi:MAG TPA: hypothetical protein VJ717_15895 [Gemmatimonadaceae bacterium]|nr:hypothetical protein [Gemmatimonadaceae bacterium]
MLPVRSALLLGALALMPPFFGPRRHVVENISVGDFAGNLTYNLTATPPIRRGVTSHIVIKKNFIDLVPFNMVNVSGQGASISNLANGNSGGTGFLALDVTVPGAAALGGQITLNVGLTDHFTFRVVNRGLLSGAVTKTPDPATLQGGTAWVAAVAGTDLGVPVLDGPICHSVAVSNRTNTSVQFTLQRNATCSTTSFNFRLKGSATNDPPSWATASGSSSNFGFAYVPPPPSGVACTSDPTIGFPEITSPQNQQVIQFAAGQASPAPVTVTWSANTSNNEPVPNNEWIVSHSGTLIKGTVSTTVIGTSKTYTFVLPGDYTITLRPANCGQSAPSKSVSFSMRRQ